MKLDAIVIIILVKEYYSLNITHMLLNLSEAQLRYTFDKFEEKHQKPFEDAMKEIFSGDLLEAVLGIGDLNFSSILNLIENRTLHHAKKYLLILFFAVTSLRNRAEYIATVLHHNLHQFYKNPLRS